MWTSPADGPDHSAILVTTKTAGPTKVFRSVAQTVSQVKSNIPAAYKDVRDVK